MSFRSSTLIRFLLRAASVAMLGFGGVLLLADSANCPDGYTEQTFDASFTSDCPASFAPAQGTLRLVVPGDIPAQMRTAGFGPLTATPVDRSDGDKCAVASFTVRSATQDVTLSCEGITVGKAEQTVRCSGSTVTPPVFAGVGLRDLPDASLADATVSTDAGGNDAASTLTPEAGVSTTSDSGDASPATGPSSTGSSGTVARPVTCSITLKKI